MAKQRTTTATGRAGDTTATATVTVTTPGPAKPAPSAKAKPPESHGGTFVLGLLLGGAAGALYGLLNAPNRGADSRAGLAGIWQDAVELTAEGLAEADNRVRSRLAGEPPLAAAGDGATTFG